MFPQFLSAYLKSTTNFEHFQKTGEPHSWRISKIINSKKRGYLNA